jgi:HSP20 family molecular chaperone IbpA
MSKVHGATEASFQALLRIATASAAYPPWFAPPIDAEEDEDTVTVLFDAPERKNRRLQIDATERRLILWERMPGGARSAIRVCSLPFEIVETAVETARSGVLLRVRMLKRRPAKALPAPSST